MNKLSLTLLSTGAAAFLGLAITAEATVPGSIVMTEVSSTTLTYSVDGGPTQTVTDSSPYDFTFNVPDNLVVTGINSEQYIFVDWQASPTMLDLVTFFQYDDAQNGSTITITGCAPPDPNHTYPVVANGGTYTFGFPDQYTATFTDLACDSAPDGGTTVGLLGFGLVCLFVIRARLSKTGV
jgi:hypothetical protein